MAWLIATYCEKPQLLWLIPVLRLMIILDGFTSTSLATLNSKPICPEQNYAASFYQTPLLLGTALGLTGLMCFGDLLIQLMYSRR